MGWRTVLHYCVDFQSKVLLPSGEAERELQLRKERTGRLVVESVVTLDRVRAEKREGALSAAL